MSVITRAEANLLNQQEAVKTTPTLTVAQDRLLVVALAHLAAIAAKERDDAEEDVNCPVHGTDARQVVAGNEHTLDLIACTIAELGTASDRALPGSIEGYTDFAIRPYTGEKLLHELMQRRNKYFDEDKREAFYATRGDVLFENYREEDLPGGMSNAEDDLIAALRNIFGDNIDIIGDNEEE